MMPESTLFQVSTSRSLVAGVYDGVVSVADLLHHGDFGLGTFAALDGEMVVLESVVYQATGDGAVKCADPMTKTPFAAVTRFNCEATRSIGSVRAFDDLTAACDELRRSDNLFYAFRVDGRFDLVHVRATTPVRSSGIALTEVVANQTVEFAFPDVVGTLVGIWSPPYSAALCVPEYHFHFISADRSKGGHVLGCQGSDLGLQCQTLETFQLSLAGSEDFLKADLSKDTSGDLIAVETFSTTTAAEE
ncbi:MAG TPA: acetolactate decarboxylase [Candidatus Acidoferrum sp.]|nr:acetolactate decarboxylase [Candidatus Acidoferrum sp.]